MSFHKMFYHMEEKMRKKEKWGSLTLSHQLVGFLSNNTSLQPWALSLCFDQCRVVSLCSEKIQTVRALLVDWQELLDPEVIRLIPVLQEQLLFCKQTQCQPFVQRAHSSQPYLMALLTHQSGWPTLHRCVQSLLTEMNTKFVFCHFISGCFSSLPFH